MASATNHLYRLLPGVNEVLEHADVVPLLGAHSRELVTASVRAVLATMREQVRTGELAETALATLMAKLGSLVLDEVHRHLRPSLQRVINATGVILQTNLGRAPLSEQAIAHITEVARGYCNLEFDLEAGKRSKRDVHAEALLLRLISAHASHDGHSDDGKPYQVRSAAVVNNCAAATFLALNTLAEGGEVIVSRGELVEIGGGFRIPDILAKSGATLREVGTTNKTRINDYAMAIGTQTRLILRVHRSNFRIEGFTEQPALEELVALGARTSVPVFEDQGTGCIVDLVEQGLPGEASLLRSVDTGVSLVAASGDKLMGGPQCGLLLGTVSVIEQIRANPLYRALRVDKLTYAALEATLLAYLSGAPEQLPTVRMLRLSAAEVRLRCANLVQHLRAEGVDAEVVETQSVVGGGTTPGATLPSYAVAVQHSGEEEEALAARLRSSTPAIVGRVSNGRVLLDLRTVEPEMDQVLATTLLRLVQPGRSGLRPTGVQG